MTHLRIVLFSLIIMVLLPSISPCPADEYPELDLDIQSVPTDCDITLTWSLPKSIPEDSTVLIVRKEEMFPEKTTDGKRVYFGHGTRAVDADLVGDTEYRYRFFLLDSNHQVIAWARHIEKT
ncbi:MAG: hypothetical protein JRI22_23140 [Deltaproteobacteria bacterium]|nr:hypothetical protein [Deltaproteobacteria bacterium]